MDLSDTPTAGATLLRLESTGAIAGGTLLASVGGAVMSLLLLSCAFEDFGCCMMASGNGDSSERMALAVAADVVAELSVEDAASTFSLLPFRTARVLLAKGLSPFERPPPAAAPAGAIPRGAVFS